MKIIITVITLMLVSSCTSLKANKASNINNAEICVINNLSVKSAFTDAYVRQIMSNGYKAKLVNERDASGCSVTSTYTAKYGFHWGVYLAVANLKIFKNGELIGDATYKAPYMSMAKHGRVENKIDAIVNELLPQI